MLRRAVLLLFALLTLPAVGLAATGDILYSNCAGEACTGAGSGNGYIRTVETNGCFAGDCLKFDALWNNDKYGTGSARLSTSSVSGKNELTVVYYVKLSCGSRAAGGNIKGIRPYYNSTNIIFATMDAHFGYDHYISPMQQSTLDPEPAVTSVHLSDVYCQDNGDGTYECSETDGGSGRMELKYTAGGADGLPPNVWRKIRLWLKLPSTTSAADGQAKLWVDESLVYHLYEVRGTASYSNTSFAKLDFYPSSELPTDFDHWLDEMVIYEGLVPPAGESRDLTPPSISARSPAPESTGVPPSAEISAVLQDSESGVDMTTISLAINGVAVLDPLIDGTPESYTISYAPPAGLAPGQTQAVIDASDLAGNAMPSSSWSFAVETEPLVTADGRPLADAGARDAGARDAASYDAATGPDSGEDQTKLGGGCGGCSTSAPGRSGQGVSLTLLLVILLGWRSARRLRCGRMR